MRSIRHKHPITTQLLVINPLHVGISNFEIQIADYSINCFHLISIYFPLFSIYNCDFRFKH